jgi:hypothetical protein
VNFIKITAERSSRKAQILDRLVEMQINAVIYESADKVNEKAARDGCLRLLMRDHPGRKVRRLVLEREESRVDSDSHIIRSELVAAGETGQLVYEHMRAHEEPLLSIPDAIAWCWMRGSHRRVIAKGLVTVVQQA